MYLATQPAPSRARLFQNGAMWPAKSGAQGHERGIGAGRDVVHRNHIYPQKTTGPLIAGAEIHTETQSEETRKHSAEGSQLRPESIRNEMIMREQQSSSRVQSSISGDELHIKKQTQNR